MGCLAAVNVYINGAESSRISNRPQAMTTFYAGVTRLRQVKSVRAGFIKLGEVMPG